MERLSINNFKYGLINSAYMFPNAIMPIIGGYFIDKFGYKKSIIAISLIFVLG